MIRGEPMVLQTLAILAALAASAPGDVTVREPTLPDSWVQTFEVRCGSERFRVANYGARLPYPGAGPIITSNGRLVRGPQIEALRRDLSTRTAAYRLTGQCLPDREGIWFVIVSGEIIYPVEGRDGQMRYLAGSATIRRGRLVEYHALQPATEETYWFR
jgi:hypothetical protein